MIHVAIRYVLGVLAAAIVLWVSAYSLGFVVGLLAPKSGDRISQALSTEKGGCIFAAVVTLALLLGGVLGALYLP